MHPAPDFIKAIDFSGLHRILFRPSAPPSFSISPSDLFQASMAPKVKKGHGKQAEKFSTRERSWEELRTSEPFFDPGCSKKMMVDLQGAVSTVQNEYGATVLHHADGLPTYLTPLDVRVPLCFILAGFVPPMSAFFHVVMASYSLPLAQLHPNIVLGLSIFQYFCETFVGVHPSVALFRHYLYPRVETGDHVSGAVSFCHYANQSDQFIPTTQNKR